MVIDDADPDGVGSGLQLQVNVEDQAGFGAVDVDLSGIQKGLQSGTLSVCHGADDLQLLVGVAADDAGADRRADAVQPAGVGHDHTLDIFDDVAADTNIYLFGQLSQQLAGLGTGVSQGNGLGTAHGRPQLLRQDVQILLIQQIAFFHRFVLRT